MSLGIGGPPSNERWSELVEKADVLYVEEMERRRRSGSGKVEE
jgi:hypothetical protein